MTFERDSRQVAFVVVLELHILTWHDLQSSQKMLSTKSISPSFSWRWGIFKGLLSGICQVSFYGLEVTLISIPLFSKIVDWFTTACETHVCVVGHTYKVHICRMCVCVFWHFSLSFSLSPTSFWTWCPPIRKPIIYATNGLGEFYLSRQTASSSRIQNTKWPPTQKSGHWLTD